MKPPSALRVHDTCRALIANCRPLIAVSQLEPAPPGAIYHRMSNALLDFSDLPQFDRITPADVAPAMNALLEKASAALETVTAADFPARWDATANVLEQIRHRTSGHGLGGRQSSEQRGRHP